MTQQNEFSCPVCRAKQAQQAECRRCGADLSLWLKTLLSLEVAQHQAREEIVKAERAGQPVVRNSLDYLHWLSPKHARAISPSSEACSDATSTTTFLESQPPESQPHPH